MLIVVSLRFVACHLSKADLWYDDWLILPATVRQFLILFIIQIKRRESRSEPVYFSVFYHDVE